MPKPPHSEGALLATDLHIEATYRLTEALVESENRMRRRVELLSEIVFETNQSGALVFLNSAWAATLGHPPEKCLGRPLSVFVFGEDQPICEMALKGTVSSQSVGRPRIRLLRADGGTAWMDISAAQLADGGVVGALHDVTKEKRAQDEIIKLSLVASYTDNFVIITDHNGRTEWVNQAFTKRTGYRLEDMAGRKPGEVLQGPGTDRQTVAQVSAWLAEGRSFNAELLNYTRTGEPYWVSFHISPIRDANGRVERFVSIQTDSTELRRTQRELEAAKERAEHLAVEAQAANRAKSEFLATMSHEIRTPMNGILGMTDLLGQTRLDPRQRELTEAVSQSGQALLGIIKDILDISEIEAGRMSLEEEEFELRPLADGVGTLVAQSAHGKPVAVRVECDEAVPARFRGDAGRLRQVLLNLVGNGLKFTSTGSLVTRIRAVGTAAQGVRLRFEVTDTGMGIPADKIALLFQPFQQLDSSPARRHGGTGLGLAISRRLVEMMGGCIGVESEEGKGSTFWFELALPVAAAQPGQGATATGLRVVVAQGQNLNRRLSLLSLEKLGCRAEAAGSAVELLDRLQTQPFDAVLLDMRLADMDGCTLAIAIREREKQAGDRAAGRPVRLIALASGVTAEEREHFLASGINVILGNPPPLADLKQALLGITS